MTTLTHGDLFTEVIYTSLPPEMKNMPIKHIEVRLSVCLLAGLLKKLGDGFEPNITGT